MAKSDVQGFRDSHARYIAARDAGKLADYPWPDFFHKPPEADDLIAECMNGFGRRNCRRRDYFGMTEEGALTMWAVIVAAGTDGRKRGEILAAYNVSFPCPPRCPNGDGEA